jgi:small GTP-binding protein
MSLRGMKLMDDQQAFKVVLCGSSFVGKTSIVHRYCYGRFDAQMAPTMGADFISESVQLPDGEVKLQIWDTAGQEQYQAIGALFFRSASLAFVVYDVTTELPLQEVRKWMERMHDIEKEAVIVVFGNKIDLVGEVKNGVAEWCAEHDTAHFFCSALTGVGIEDGFIHAAMVLKKQCPMEQASALIIQGPPERPCC